MAKNYFAYVRVSTVKQGVQGVSLEEQKDAIRRYAERKSIRIVGWFEERKTAAKYGRPVFGQMLKLLRRRKADGVVVHKLDRGSRTLYDWAEMSRLFDTGVEVEFANENLDLHTRGGRLSADIQAAVAADFIRNLSEETRKGFYGRLKQGLYPLPAPLGYLNCGKGKPKAIDPVRGPLVKQAFELYATGQYNHHSLLPELHRIGLRNRRNHRVGKSPLSRMLNNPFYFGLIRLHTGETFEGVHPALITKELFDRVQDVIAGRLNVRIVKNNFTYRRLLTCKHCEYSLIAERQKGHVYYRCHTIKCLTCTIREEVVEDAFRLKFAPVRFLDEEKQYFWMRLDQMRGEQGSAAEREVATLTMRLGYLKDRLARLTDVFIDQALDKELFEERKLAILMERREIEDRILRLKSNPGSDFDKVQEILELAVSLPLSYEIGVGEPKRDLVKKVTSNRWIDRRNVEITLSPTFAAIANRPLNSDCDPSRALPRTWDKLLMTLLGMIKLRRAN